MLRVFFFYHIPLIDKSLLIKSNSFMIMFILLSNYLNDIFILSKENYMSIYGKWCSDQTQIRWIGPHKVFLIFKLCIGIKKFRILPVTCVFVLRVFGITSVVVDIHYTLGISGMKQIMLSKNQNTNIAKI